MMALLRVGVSQFQVVPIRFPNYHKYQKTAYTADHFLSIARVACVRRQRSSISAITPSQLHTPSTCLKCYTAQPASLPSDVLGSHVHCNSTACHCLGKAAEQ